MRKVWSKIGHRPEAIVQHRYEWTYVYGFVKPKTGESLWYVIPRVNISWLNLVYQQFAIDAGVHSQKPKSDLSIWRSQRDKFKSSQKFRGDKAYVGELQIQRPHKKPPNGKLTEKEELENRESAKQRIYVEHIIRVVKIFKVAQEKFRLSSDKYSSVMKTICGLVRLRIGALVF